MFERFPVVYIYTYSERKEIMGVFPYTVDSEGFIHLNNAPPPTHLVDFNIERSYWDYIQPTVEVDLHVTLTRLEAAHQLHLIKSMTFYVAIVENDIEGLDENFLQGLFEMAPACKEFRLYLCFDIYHCAADGSVAMSELCKLLRAVVHGLRGMESFTLSDVSPSAHFNEYIQNKQVMNAIMVPIHSQGNIAMETFSNSGNFQRIKPNHSQYNWFQKAMFRRLCLENICMSPNNSQYFWLLVGSFHLEELVLINTNIEWPTCPIFESPIPKKMILQGLQENHSTVPLARRFFLQSVEFC
jgi:hypothetical protein